MSNINNGGCFYGRQEPTNYEIKKEKIRQKAIEWQIKTSQRHNPKTWGEIWEEQTEFEKLAKLYGLVKEFKENGII